MFAKLLCICASVNFDAVVERPTNLFLFLNWCMENLVGPKRQTDSPVTMLHISRNLFFNWIFIIFFIIYFLIIFYYRFIIEILLYFLLYQFYYFFLLYFVLYFLLSIFSYYFLLAYIIYFLLSIFNNILINKIQLNENKFDYIAAL